LANYVFLPQIVSMQLQCQFIRLLEKCITWIGTGTVCAALKKIIDCAIDLFVRFCVAARAKNTRGVRYRDWSHSGGHCHQGNEENPHVDLLLR